MSDFGAAIAPALTVIGTIGWRISTTLTGSGAAGRRAISCMRQVLVET